MKKLASLILLCVFLFNTMGYFIAFKAIQYQVKNEITSAIESGLSPAELTVITINKADLHTIVWEEDGREMIYKEELYDIVKSIETPGSVTYYCINDSKEQLLFSSLDKHINSHITNNKQDKNSSAKKITDIVSKLYFPNQQLSFLFTSVSENELFMACFLYSAMAIETNSPPPEFV